MNLWSPGYTYDDRGYITRIEKDANNYSEYRYDAFGQLVRENYNWGATSYTMIFSYNVGGNIMEKNQYAFVAGDGQVGTPVDTIPYTYDATWQDKLASYDGTSITYDSIGNPLDDGTWEYTWTQGTTCSRSPTAQRQQAINITTAASVPKKRSTAPRPYSTSLAATLHGRRQGPIRLSTSSMTRAASCGD